MSVKKIGKAKALPEEGLWGVEQKSERFIMNPRIVERRPEVKELRKAYSNQASRVTPSRRKPEQRDAYYEQRQNVKAELIAVLAKVYAEILKESFTEPVILKKSGDAEYGRDRRYCLFEGVIYQFDRSGYPSEEMIRQIRPV